MALIPLAGGHWFVLGRRLGAWALRNNWLRGGVNTALGVAMIVLLLRSVSAGAILHHLQPRHFEPVIGLLALTLLSQLVRAGRWMLLLRGLTRVGYREALWVNASTQLLNYAVPVRAGEALRLWWLHRRRRVPIAGALGIMVIDHGFDLCGVAAVLSVGSILSGLGIDRMLPSLTGMLIALGLALAMFSAIVLSVVVGPRVAVSPWVRRLLRPVWQDRLRGHATAVRGAAATLCGRRRLALMIGASAVAVILDGLAFAMLFMALGLGVPLFSALVTQVTLLYATLLPSAPGYVGSLEAGGTFLLSTRWDSPVRPRRAPWSSGMRWRRSWWSGWGWSRSTSCVLPECFASGPPCYEGSKEPPNVVRRSG